ncbi:MAG: transposase [Candidatus Omnitrophica bacterium]|nr:transposase [Candidatus Omnitrophota bacterium]
MRNNMRRRKNLRLQDWDYSQNGYYFVTVCVKDRIPLLGEIMNGQILLNDAGRMVESIWKELPIHYPIDIDAFVVMPNHVHGIIVIDNSAVGAGSPGPMAMGGGTPPLRTITLGKIIAYFKYKTTKLINKIRNTPGVKLWQRNYYEHIIRNEESLYAVRQYINENPRQWHLDKENPMEGWFD